jgi:tetraacyldisaccharide 4'-kinase
MNKARKYLKPLSVLYEKIVKVRNNLYDKEVLKSTKFEIPTIVVGNLSVGGTGKSPMIEYLVRLLKNDYRVAVLSRGYKRKSKGFLLANEHTKVAEIGDEPMQFFQKFKNDNVLIAADANRVNGINELLKLKNPPQVILLDDAYQHRKVQGGFNILLTPYNELYVDDSMLPSGDLRENISGAKRAQVIIVTKCPDYLSEEEQFKITQKLNVEMHQTVFFTKIAYAEEIVGKNNRIPLNELKDYQILLVTGIAKTKPLTEFLTRKNIPFKHLSFKDHYNFKASDLRTIRDEFHKINSEKKLILTTEKDYVRTFADSDLEVYYLPIKTEFLDHQKSFNTKIKRYVGQSSRDS